MLKIRVVSSYDFEQLFFSQLTFGIKLDSKFITLT